MLSFKRILFPIDFSPRCLQMAPYVAAVAAAFQSEVTLLHICDPAGVDRDASNKALADFARGAFEDVYVTRILSAGRPAQSIVEHARYYGIGVIMLPTRGFSPFREDFLGSTTAALLLDTDWPVWTTAHSGEAGAEALRLPIRRIVCGLDFGSRDEHVIRTATALACAFGAAIRLLNVMESPDETAARAARERMAAIQESAGTQWGIATETGPVADGIRRSALDYDADLVVTGRGALSPRTGGARSNIGPIILQSPCPVFSL